MTFDTIRKGQSKKQIPTDTKEYGRNSHDTYRMCNVHSILAEASRTAIQVYTSYTQSFI